MPIRISKRIEKNIYVALVGLKKIVEGYDYEPFSISYYESDNHLRYYFPDFVVRFYNQPKLKIIEVKNDYAMKFETNKLKDKYTKQFAKKQGYEYEIWSNDKIVQLKIDPNDFKDRYTLFVKDVKVHIK